MNGKTRTLSIIIVDLDGRGEISATVAYGEEKPGPVDSRTRLELALEVEPASLQEWAQMAAAAVVNEL